MIVVSWVYMCESPRVKFLTILREKKGWTRYRAARELKLGGQQGYDYLEHHSKSIRLSVLSEIRRTFEITWEELGALIDGEVSGEKAAKKKKKARSKRSKVSD